MRYPQVIVFEPDGRLANLLQPLIHAQSWLLRQPRRVETALKLLARGGPQVLVIRAGRDLEREFGLLQQAALRYPEAFVLLVLDNDHPRLPGLGWDLGATFVLSPGESRDRIAQLLQSLLHERDDDSASPGG